MARQFITGASEMGDYACDPGHGCTFFSQLGLWIGSLHAPHQSTSILLARKNPVGDNQAVKFPRTITFSRHGVAVVPIAADRVSRGYGSN